MRIVWHRWMTAFSLAVLMHVIVMAGLFWEPDIHWNGDTASSGIEISIGTAAEPGRVAATIREILEAEIVVAPETASQRPGEKTVTPAPVQARAVDPVVPGLVKPAQVVRAATLQTTMAVASHPPTILLDPPEAESVTPAAPPLAETARAAEPGRVAATIREILEAEIVVAPETSPQRPGEKTVTPAPVQARAVDPVVPGLVKPAQVVRAATLQTTMAVASHPPTILLDPLEAESVTPAAPPLAETARAAEPGRVAATIREILEAEIVVAPETSPQRPGKKTVTPAPVQARAVDPVVPGLVKPAQVVRAATLQTTMAVASHPPTILLDPLEAESVTPAAPPLVEAARAAEPGGVAATIREILEAEIVVAPKTAPQRPGEKTVTPAPVQARAVDPVVPRLVKPAEVVQAAPLQTTMAVASHPPTILLDPLEAESVTPAAPTLAETARAAEPGSVAATIREVLEAEIVVAPETSPQRPGKKTVTPPPPPVPAQAVEPVELELAKPAEVVQAAPLQTTMAVASHPPTILVDPPEAESVTPAATTLVEAARAETAATAVEVGSVAAQPVEQPSPAKLVEAMSPKTTLTPRLAEETGAWADYAARLQAWLQKYKEYPASARFRGQEGTVSLYLVIDRKGLLRNYRIERSSGYHLLDRAAVAMIKRAQPLPWIPDNLDGTQVVLLVPVQFVLR